MTKPGAAGSEPTGSGVSPPEPYWPPWPRVSIEQVRVPGGGPGQPLLRQPATAAVAEVLDDGGQVREHPAGRVYQARTGCPSNPANVTSQVSTRVSPVATGTTSTRTSCRRRLDDGRRPELVEVGGLGDGGPVALELVEREVEQRHGQATVAGRCGALADHQLGAQLDARVRRRLAAGHVEHHPGGGGGHLEQGLVDGGERRGRSTRRRAGRRSRRRTGPGAPAGPARGRRGARPGPGSRSRRRSRSAGRAGRAGPCRACSRRRRRSRRTGPARGRPRRRPRRARCGTRRCGRGCTARPPGRR